MLCCLLGVIVICDLMLVAYVGVFLVCVLLCSVC